MRGGRSQRREVSATVYTLSPSTTMQSLNSAENLSLYFCCCFLLGFFFKAAAPMKDPRRPPSFPPCAAPNTSRSEKRMKWYPHGLPCRSVLVSGPSLSSRRLDLLGALCRLLLLLFPVSPASSSPSPSPPPPSPPPPSRAPSVAWSLRKSTPHVAENCRILCLSSCSFILAFIFLATSSTVVTALRKRTYSLSAWRCPAAASSTRLEPSTTLALLPCWPWPSPPLAFLASPAAGLPLR
mmetsp:Transcript_21851/g.44894  ORF Transcript_21851/g.44894 Transcript_21851/m.44894 type:complete len:238 (+) Transcript_21851:752-1465(+)